MKFEIEIPDQSLQDICSKAVENAMNDNRFPSDFGSKLKGLIEISTKSSINKVFNNYEAIIAKKVEENIDKVVNEIVSNRLENRVKQVLSSQLKQKSLLD